MPASIWDFGRRRISPSSMYRDHVLTWLRYIDDVLMIWRGTLDNLHDFMRELNTNQGNIRLTYNFDQRKLSFLDLQITLENGQLSTCTFRKKTAANTLLQATSHHPQWLKNGIPVGQFLRIKRNCTSAADYRRESLELYARFRERGYSHRQIKRDKKKAAMKDRMCLLRNEPVVNESPPEKIDPVRIITAFGSQWNKVRSILEKHWGILTNSPELARIVSTSPKLVA